MVKKSIVDLNIYFFALIAVNSILSVNYPNISKVISISDETIILIYLAGLLGLGWQLALRTNCYFLVILFICIVSKACLFVSSR